MSINKTDHHWNLNCFCRNSSVIDFISTSDIINIICPKCGSMLSVPKGFGVNNTIHFVNGGMKSIYNFWASLFTLFMFSYLGFIIMISLFIGSLFLMMIYVWYHTRDIKPSIISLNKPKVLFLRPHELDYMIGGTHSAFRSEDLPTINDSIEGELANKNIILKKLAYEADSLSDELLIKPDPIKWKAKIKEAINWCDIVFIVPGLSPGIAWETGQVLANYQKNRKETIFIFPPDKRKSVAYSWNELINRYKVPLLLHFEPAYYPILLYLSSDGNSHWVFSKHTLFRGTPNKHSYVEGMKIVLNEYLPFNQTKFQGYTFE